MLRISSVVILLIKIQFLVNFVNDFFTPYYLLFNQSGVK